MKFANFLIILTALLGTTISIINSPAQATMADDLTIQEQLKFETHSQTRLPTYKKYFKQYSELYNIPWTLLAAVAYQESKWNNSAVSHTGVKGLMQITAKTAEHIGIEDRENPLESIKGAAYYLRYLYEKTPEHLLTTQRWALALAAYNIGWGHIRDAYRLAHRLNLNANSWEDLREVLPKLEEKEFYSDLAYGFARGNETVDFVENVFGYFNVLNHKFQVETELAKR